MKLQAKVQLNLPKTYNTIALEYHTYEKATFDQYLAASIALRAENKEEIDKYIDELTGKGSLNSHFKKIVEYILGFDKESIQKILNSSMFPVTKIDKSNKYTYYPYFDISVINNKKYFNGNLKNYTKDQILEALLINVDLITFNVSEKDESDKVENYSVLFTDDSLKINLLGNEWIDFSFKHFSESRKKTIIDKSLYRGIIKQTADGENWSILTEASFNSIIKYERAFIGESEDYCLLTNDYIRKVQIAYLSNIDLYFFTEERINFDKKNSRYCELALKYLLNNSIILNEIKVKTLVNILNCSDDFSAQEVINYILSRKKSKEISQVGLRLISRGLENHWDDKALLEMRQFANTNELNLLYKINNSLNFSISELLLIDNNLLTEDDRNRRDEYMNSRKNKIDEIQKIIGEITSSGLRQKSKSKLKQSLPELKVFTKYCNKYIGHEDKSLDELSDIDLEKRLKDIQKFYENYKLIKKMYEAIE